MKLLITIFTLLFNISTIYAAETCSRVAIINYQEVLVDTTSNSKGEGLRFYLKKDAKAEKLLDKYQEINRPSTIAASTSTLGSVMVLGGLLQTNQASGFINRNTLIYGGLILSTISYLVSKTVQYNSEEILQQAVEQYNKRNLPRIYFSPYQDNNNLSIGLGIQQEF